MRRLRGARERRHLTLLKAEPQQGNSAAEEALEVESDRARVQAALDELSPRDREALLLWDSGLSYEEIAAQTGLARGAIGTTLSRARRRLAQAFEAGKAGGHVAPRWTPNAPLSRSPARAARGPRRRRPPRPPPRPAPAARHT